MVSGVIQARMNSTRLPGKTLLEFEGRSILEWVINAVDACPSIDNVIVATSDNPADDPVAEEATQKGAGVFRGDEDDVLGRFLGAIETFDLDVVVRICADRPLYSPWVADGIVRHYIQSGADYVSNNMQQRTFPMGTEAEVVHADVLKESAKIADRPSDREHVTPVLRRRLDLFSNLCVLAPGPIHRPAYRLCLDTQDEYEIIAEIYDLLDHPANLPPDVVDVVNLLDRREDLTEHMYEAEDKYNPLHDAPEEVDTVEMSMDVRDEFYRIHEESMTG